MPILKARQAEFLALDHVDPALTTIIRPVLEVTPGRSGRLYESVLGFGDKVMECIPKGMAFAADCRHLRTAFSEVPDRPLSLVAAEVHLRGKLMLPVFGLDDGQDPRQVREAASLHGAGGCLRLEPRQLLHSGSEEVTRLLAQTRLPAEDTDLLIDVGDVSTPTSRDQAVRLVQTALSWCHGLPWRSVTVAAGAFPASISDLPLGRSTAVARWDADLWVRLAHGNRRQVGFGDYAVRNPQLLAGMIPLPNLRYTGKRHWHVSRFPKPEDGGLTSFHDLCEAVTSSAYWPAHHSGLCWGDREIQRCARRHRGPGNPTQWLAFGFSHHLATVAERLTVLGEP